MRIAERLACLKQKMKEEDLDYFLITSQDYHNSEYVHEHFKAREYFSGFDGSNGSLLVSQDAVGLWTDGRYFLQAEEQLAGTGIYLFKMGEKGVPTITEYLQDHMKNGQTIGTDGRCLNYLYGNSLEKICERKHGKFVYKTNIVTESWSDRPVLSGKKIWTLQESEAGESIDSKLNRVREYLAQRSAEYLFISKLDDIMWLYNLRGSDITCNPVALSYTLIGKKEAYLYVFQEAVPDKIMKEFERHAIHIISYQDALFHLTNLEWNEGGLCLEQESVSYTFYKELEKKTNVIRTALPTTLWKAKKNAIEQQNIRDIYLQDSAIVCKFIYWLKKMMENGEKVTEMSAAAYLDHLREKIPGFLDTSFETISGYAENGAIVHYEATDKTNRLLEPRGLFLVDSGGQYIQGTTDITRTIALGKTTEEEKKLFSAVTAGMLKLADTVFLSGCTGRNLDILAREALWKMLLDYKHGTGHGIGYVLNVHEGPQRIFWKYSKDSEEVILEPGMLLSDEPGVYLDHKFGIRIENIVMVQPLDENEYGSFLHFEMLTFVPIDRSVLSKQYLSEDDIKRINRYHKEVYEKMSSFMTDEELSWLQSETSPLE